MIGIDLFAGAGGMSLGAEQAGVEIIAAVEKDPHACATFRHNFASVNLFEGDISTFTPPLLPQFDSIVFGGPPCQGFSTSNQRTRNKQNPINWMFEEFFRVVEQAAPEWVVFENVKGLIETEKGFFLEQIIKRLTDIGFACSYAALNSAEYGVPQVRNRLFVVGNRRGKKFIFPPRAESRISVGEAIVDLPTIENGASISWLPYSKLPNSDYAATLRAGRKMCGNNIVSKNSTNILARYRHVPQGGNWQNIPDELMDNYKDRSRCHTGIYHRLKLDIPSVVLGNFRKNMLIHPLEDRGLSVREAARLQSFPDSFEFCGSIGFQQQQVGNAVPPKLAEAIFKHIQK